MANFVVRHVCFCKHYIAIQLKERQLLLLSTIYKAGEIVTVAEHEKKDEEKYSDTDPDGLLMAKSHATHKSACVCVCVPTFLYTMMYHQSPSSVAYSELAEIGGV